MPETVPPISADFLVARQDYQFHQLTHYLAARPRSNGSHWQWNTAREEALPLTQADARQLAGQYNALPDDVRRGSVARVEGRAEPS